MLTGKSATQEKLRQHFRVCRWRRQSPPRTFHSRLQIPRKKNQMKISPGSVRTNGEFMWTST